MRRTISVKWLIIQKKHGNRSSTWQLLSRQHPTVARLRNIVFRKCSLSIFSTSSTPLPIPSPSPLPSSPLLFPLNTKRSIPHTCRTRILRPQARNHCLGTQTLILARLARGTHIRKLITDAVRDDIRVQRVMLALCDHRVRGQEGAFCGFAVECCAAKLEVHCWAAGAKIC